jgi:hypothetical protein
MLCWHYFWTVVIISQKKAHTSRATQEREYAIKGYYQGKRMKFVDKKSFSSDLL